MYCEELGNYGSWQTSQRSQSRVVAAVFHGFSGKMTVAVIDWATEQFPRKIRPTSPRLHQLKDYNSKTVQPFSIGRFSLPPFQLTTACQIQKLLLQWSWPFLIGAFKTNNMEKKSSAIRSPAWHNSKCVFYIILPWCSSAKLNIFPQYDVCLFTVSQILVASCEPESFPPGWWREMMESRQEWGVGACTNCPLLSQRLHVLFYFMLYCQGDWEKKLNPIIYDKW